MSKKVDKKVVAKKEYIKELTDYFTAKGLQVEDGEKFGKVGSIVVHDKNSDIQVKVISPKSNVTRYAIVDDGTETD